MKPGAPIWVQDAPAPRGPLSSPDEARQRRVTILSRSASNCCSILCLTSPVSPWWMPRFRCHSRPAAVSGTPRCRAAGEHPQQSR